MHAWVHMHVCVCVCVRTRARTYARMRACMCACVLLSLQPDQVPLDENLIVSHYLHNPLVIDGKYLLYLLPTNVKQNSVSECLWN